jgi:hypothetical protein
MFYCNSCLKSYANKFSYITHLEKNAHITKKIILDLYYLLSLADKITEDICLFKNTIKDKGIANKIDQVNELLNKIIASHNNLSQEKLNLEKLHGNNLNINSKIKKLYESFLESKSFLDNLVSELVNTE